MNISLHQLKVFVAVARHKNFTRAAGEFGLTQSAVSRCVRELEDELCLKLFDRTTRHVELTSAGANLESRIGRLLDEIELTLRAKRSEHDAHTGIVLVASNPVLSATLLPPSLARCAAAFPELVVTVRDRPQNAVLTSVQLGEVDFGVISDVVSNSNASANADGNSTLRDFHAQALFSTPLCAVLPAAHALARRAILKWTDLNDVPLVTLSQDSGSRLAIERALTVHDVSGRSMQEFGHIAAVLRMVELGLGVGIVPIDARWPALAASTVARPLLPELTLTTLLVTRKNRSLRPNAQAVWTLFASEAVQRAPAAVASIRDSAAVVL
jgi:DNA-binding transcriptional LysR family regulator